MRYFFHEMLNNIHRLSHSERTELRNSLANLDNLDHVSDLIETGQDTDRHCQHCGSHDVYKHGVRSNIQRYKCKTCKRTFNALTGTPLAHLRMKEKWLPYFDNLRLSHTLRESSKSLGINLRTSFLWRHRFIHWFSKDVPDKLPGIIEADETYFNFSMKGNRHLPRKPHKRGFQDVGRGLSRSLVCVFTACNRSHESVEKVAGRGAISSHWLEKEFAPFIPDDAIVVSDGHKSYEGFCLRLGIEHIVVSSKKGRRVRDAFHIQHINSFHQRLKSWIDFRFHGVATKYLEHYLGWRHELEKYQTLSNEQLLMAAIGNFTPLPTT